MDSVENNELFETIIKFYDRKKIELSIIYVTSYFCLTDLGQVDNLLKFSQGEVFGHHCHATRTTWLFILWWLVLSNNLFFHIQGYQSQNTDFSSVLLQCIEEFVSRWQDLNECFFNHIIFHLNSLIHIFLSAKWDGSIFIVSMSYNMNCAMVTCQVKFMLHVRVWKFEKSKVMLYRKVVSWIILQAGTLLITLRERKTNTTGTKRVAGPTQEEQSCFFKAHFDTKFTRILLS